MYKYISIAVIFAYLGFIYKFHKNDILMLLSTLIVILILCNLKNIEGQSEENTPNSGYTSKNSNPSPNKNVVTLQKPVQTNSPSNNTNKVNSNKANSNKVNSNKANSANSNKNTGPKGYGSLRFEMASNYQMGPYDNLMLT